MRTLTTALAGVALGASLVTGSLVYGADSSHHARTAHTYGAHHAQRMAVPRWMTRPCATEDSVNCYWDAHARGNGTGHSFYVREFPGSARMVCVTYVGTRYAAHHDYCEATR